MKDQTKQYWENRWLNNQITFHQEKVQEALIRSETLLPKGDSKKAFVPLCGKTLDLLWLKEKGFEVHGAELSEIAVEDFFKENQLERNIQIFNEGKLYSSEKIHLFQGDLFKIPKELQETYQFDFIYDRASLIALDDNVRPRYYEFIKSVMKPGAKMLLLLFESTQVPPKVPPYPISKEELRKNFGDGFKIEKLEEKIETKEWVYLVTKKS